jgi:xylulokinase
VLEGVAYNSRWLLATVEKFVGRPFPWLHFVGGGAQSELWCRIMADVLDREIRQVEHPIRANARGAALLAGIALGRIGVDDLARHVRIANSYTPGATNRAIYDDRYAEFRTLHKQTSRRTKRHDRRAT